MRASAPWADVSIGFEEATAHYEISIFDEPLFTEGSVDNPRSYAREYVLERGGWSRHGVLCHATGRLLGSAIITAGGGISGVHERSLIAQRRRCFVAVGDHVICLQLPDLDLLWSIKADSATVFGLHLGPDREDLVVHGELEISRLTRDGSIVWSQSGADVFSESVSVMEDYVEAIDFNGRHYRFRYADGK